MPLVSLHPSKMVPLPGDFWHSSTLHGQAHVTRVMVHAIRLVEATGQHHLGPRLWASVFLHDLARTHDGVVIGMEPMRRSGFEMSPRCKRGWQRQD